MARVTMPNQQVVLKNKSLCYRYRHFTEIRVVLAKPLNVPEAQ